MEDIENAGNWDFEKAVIHPPSKGNRVVVSVAFPRTMFEQIARCADHVGMRVSEFIREASLEKAVRQTEAATLASVSGPFAGVILSQGKISPASGSSTRVPGGKPLAVHQMGQLINFVNEPATV